MNCTKCNGSTKVIDRRGTRRRRECVCCGTRFSTVEVLASEVKRQPVVKPQKEPKPAKAKPVKPKVTTVAVIKRNANARRKIEAWRESFLDPDYDFIPEKW